MKSSDKFLIAALFGVLAFELGPDLWKEFEKSVLQGQPPDRRPISERTDHTPASDLEHTYEIRKP